jgi:hypothetical protein
LFPVDSVSCINKLAVGLYSSFLFWVVTLR